MDIEEIKAKVKLVKGYEDLTPELLKILFTYRDGNLYWNYSPANNTPIGSFAGSSSSDNCYVFLRINRKQFCAHRCVWIMHHGSIPAGFVIDHINGDGKDNRIENLRLATLSQNGANSKVPRTNTSGVKGVCWNKREGKWYAQMRALNKRYAVGYFATLEEAESAVKEFREKLHGEFANHGQHKKL